MKNILKTFGIQFVLFMILLVTFGVAYAAWDDNVSPGDLVSSTSWNDIVSQIQSKTSLSTPPTCNGASNALRWNGSSWSCGTVSSLSTPPTCSGASNALRWNGSSWSCGTVVRECRVCIQQFSNTTADGPKRCTSYSSAGTERASSVSSWAIGSAYANRIWIQCR